jgi:ABC-type uncharacterized transport system YnjBCD substrate-binding protein
MDTNDPLYNYYQALMEVAWRSGSSDPKELEKLFFEENDFWKDDQNVLDNLPEWCKVHAQLNETGG